MERGSVRAAALVVSLVALVAQAVRADDVVRARLTAEGGRAVVEMTIAPSWHVNSNTPSDEFLIPTTLTIVAPAGMRAGEVSYPQPVERKLAFGGDQKFRLYQGSVRLSAPLEGTASPGARVHGALRFQACDDSRCLPPKTLDLSVDVGEKGGGAAPDAGAGADQVQRWVARFGYPLTFAWVALLGLALNLTPCVYPLISVTVGFFGGRTGDATGRVVIRRAALYVLGICLSFSALGVAAALTGSLFGAALQRPAVLIAIAALLVALAASNFGLYQLRAPPAVTQRLGRAAEGDGGALLMGLTMGVVAAPCIGPVVVALLLFVGAQQSILLGFALFFVLGLGMGAPYLALAAVAGRLRALPRAGAWLGWVEHVFGFLLLGLALYFVAPLLPDAWVRAATALLLASAGVVLGLRGPRPPAAFGWLRRVTGVALLAMALAGWLEAETHSPVVWAPFSEAALEQAHAEGRPVLLDFRADWCLPCREMEHTTFRQPSFVEVAKGFVTLKVDVTANDERATELMQRFRVVGVPTYVLLGRDGSEERRFVGFVPADEMVQAMRELGRNPRV